MNLRVVPGVYVCVIGVVFLLFYLLVRSLSDRKKEEEKKGKDGFDKMSDLDAEVNELVSRLDSIVEGKAKNNKERLESENYEIEQNGKLSIIRKKSPRDILSEDVNMTIDDLEISEIENEISPKVDEVTPMKTEKAKKETIPPKPVFRSDFIRRRPEPELNEKHFMQSPVPSRKKIKKIKKPIKTPEKKEKVSSPSLSSNTLKTPTPPKKRRKSKKKPSLDFSEWNKVYENKLKMLKKKGFREVTPKRNPHETYYCNNSTTYPCKRFHYRSFYSSREKTLTSYVYFGKCLLGPGTVHGGALASISLELSFLFCKNNGLFPERVNYLKSISSIFLDKVELEKIFRIDVKFERMKKNNTIFEVCSTLMDVKDEKKVYFIYRGEFAKKYRDGSHYHSSVKKMGHKRTNLEGMKGMTKLFVNLVKEQKFEYIEHYREHHKYLLDYNHLLNYDQKANVRRMSNYFNFKVLIRSGLEGQFLIFFGKGTEGEAHGCVHDAALVSAFDALAGLTCCLNGYPNVHTNTMSVDFCEGEKLETLRPYRMLVKDKILKKDVLNAQNLIRTKHSVSATIHKIDPDYLESESSSMDVISRFNGIFIDYRVLIDNGNGYIE